MRVEIVDDNPATACSIERLTRRFFEECGLGCSIERYASGVEFIKNYRPGADLVLLDILMPGLDGMATARELRTVDPLVPLIFITSSVTYAVAGYEVDALSYLVKPVSWSDFSSQLQRAVARRQRHSEPMVCIATKPSVVRMRASDVVYVETKKHTSTVHTVTHSIPLTMSLKALRENFQRRIFCGLTPESWSMCAISPQLQPRPAH